MTASPGHDVARLSSSAPRLARVVLITVLVGFSLVAIATLVLRGGQASVPVAVVLLAAMLTLQVGYFARTQPYGRWRYVALAAQAVLSFWPLVVLGQPWTGGPGFLGGSLLLALPLSVGMAAAAVVVAICMTAQFRFTGAPYDVLYTGVSAVITSLVVFGLTRLAQLVVELQRTRANLARLEVTRERLRIAQDLHDLLGSSLTAITLRTELARAHLRTPAGVPRASAELDLVAGLSRQALTDVRQVSAGPLRASLDEELDQAAALLRSAGIPAQTDIDDRAANALAAEPGAAMATALREGVTNVLRHGGRRYCTIGLHRDNGRTVLTIRNDLAVGTKPAAPAGGQGLANLTNRVTAAGGSLEAGTDGPDTWQLTASVPIDDTITPRHGGGP